MDEKGFQKLQMPTVRAAQPNSTIKQNTMAKKKRFFSKNKKIILAIAAVLLIFIVITVVKVAGVYAKVKVLNTQAKAASAAAKQQNVALFKDELVKTKEKLLDVKKELSGLGYLAFVPLANWYYSDGVHGINAGEHGINAALTIADSLIPYADVLGLKGEKSFVAGSAQDRIQLAVKTMGKVVPNIDAIEEDLKKVRSEIDVIDPNHYPPIGPLKKVRDQISMARTLTDDASTSIDQAKPLIKVLPELLGEPTEKKYMILFQNNNELRPTGGFLTYYAIFKIEHGLMHVERSSDMYALDDSISKHLPPPDLIQKYLPKENVLYIRNSNLSPDFIESMKSFNQMYATSSQYQKVDGVIAIDTQVLVNILATLGEVEAAGFKFNANNDPRCDCPQVVYELESNISTPVGFVKENRKAVLGELIYAIMQKALSSSPKLYWGKLLQQGFADLSEKHILIALSDQNAQSGIEALNWAGRIKDFQGDYLHLNDANFGGQKSNLFVRQEMKVDYSVDSNKKITKTVTIVYTNSHPPSDCNLERGGLCLNAQLRNPLRLYVPKGSVLQSSKGSQVKVATKEDLGKTVFEGFMTVDPKGRTQVTFVYQLPFTPDNGMLPVMIQKQPGVYPIPYEVSVNGRTVEKFDLSQDRQTNLKLF